MDLQDYDWERLEGLGFTEKATGDLKDSCWKGYTAVGTKKKNGRTVPNCAPVKKDAEHGEGDVAMAAMTPNYLPKEPGTGPEKDPGNSKLAMKAAPNYAETEDFNDAFHSMEPNANMIITQLRVAREKIDIMLGLLYPDDNLEPWVATKIANAGVALASVADYLRFGGET